MAAITKHVDRFTETDIDDEIVIMRLTNGEFFSLSDSAAAIWRLIDGKRDRNALIAALGHEYKADALQLSAEVDEFLWQLTEAELLAEA